MPQQDGALCCCCTWARILPRPGEHAPPAGERLGGPRPSRVHLRLVSGPGDERNDQVVFLSTLESPRSSLRAVVRSQGVSFTVVAFEGLISPASHEQYESFSAPGINSAGDVVFRARLKAEAAGDPRRPSSGEGLGRKSGGRQRGRGRKQLRTDLQGIFGPGYRIIRRRTVCGAHDRFKSPLGPVPLVGGSNARGGTAQRFSAGARRSSRTHICQPR